MSVGAIVPGFRQVFGDGHAAQQEQLRANAPISEIGKRDDCISGDAQKVFQNRSRVARGLDGEAQDGIVEGPVRVVDKI